MEGNGGLDSGRFPIGWLLFSGKRAGPTFFFSSDDRGVGIDILMWNVFLV